MTENNAENDIVSHYKAEEENYKQEMEKLQKRIEKQTKQRD